MWFKKKTYIDKANLHKKGNCPLCGKLSIDMSKQLPVDVIFKLKANEENLYKLMDIEICESCFHELINLMEYKDIDDMIDFDKKQLMMFLNMVAEKIKNES